MRYFIAGGGCYGSYYLRQLDRAKKLGKVTFDEVVIVDRAADCAAISQIPAIPGARLEVCSWEVFGAQVWANRETWQNDQWVPTPIGPHIIFHWVMNQLKEAGTKVSPIPYEGSLPAIPYAKTLETGTLVLSHAPGICPTHCVEPKICPLTSADRDWEMRETVRGLIQKDKARHGIEDVGVLICQHHSHGVGTIPMKSIYEEWVRLQKAIVAGAKRCAVATVSSCHGIVDVFDRVQK